MPQSAPERLDAIKGNAIMVEKTTTEENYRLLKAEGKVIPLPYEDDGLMLGAFSDNVGVMETLLKLITQELETPAPSDLRIQVYFNDIISVQNELIAQQALAISAKGRDDPDVVRLQAILEHDIPEVQARLQVHVERLEEQKKNIDEKYADEKAKLEDEFRAIAARVPPPPPIDRPSGKGDDDGMEARISKLESDVTTIKIDVAVIKANGATKSDLAELRGALTKDFTELKGSIGELRAATKADIADAKTAIILWVVGAIFVAQILPSILKAIPELMAMLGK